MGARNELRVLPSAVSFFLKSGGTRRRPTNEEMLAELLQGFSGKTHLSGEDARLILNLTGGHINALVDDGELEVIPGTKRHRGTNGSDQITLASFKAFCLRRRV